MHPLRKLASTLVAILVAAPASAATFDATSRGWFSNVGRHTAGNLNTLAGQGSGRDRYRVFFSFDLGALHQPVESGVLRLELEAVLGPDAAEVFVLYDVTSSVDDLVAAQENRSDIYNDLGSGAYYGIAAAYTTDVGSIIEVPLEVDAIADINRAAGGRFAVGVSVESLRLTTGSEAIRFSLADEVRVHQLVLTEAPTPPPPAAPPTLSLGPELAAMVPPAEHAVTAQLTDAAGAPVADAPIAFSVVSGPNAGMSGNVATDATGAASFAYAGGAAGVDQIRASFSDASGTPVEAEAQTFWDADCNANQVPDACDVACGGFDGACSAFASCGGSADADADGLPDECRPANSPPDCSLATITPAMLRRADHRMVGVALGGVTDPDGDDVQLTVEAVFQDEPVESFACGGRNPDAMGIGTDHVAVRAESRERGDGRVYHVDFSADDGRGGSCEGTALLCVPRPGWRRSDECVDQGALYDSTLVNRHKKGLRWGWRGHKRH